MLLKIDNSTHTTWFRHSSFNLLINNSCEQVHTPAVQAKFLFQRGINALFHDQ